jgi:alkylation response protein AidB-like acyl-CoA dehydrogenase
MLNTEGRAAYTADHEAFRGEVRKFIDREFWFTDGRAGFLCPTVRTTARRSGFECIINGAKTFISNGQTADLIIVVAKTDTGRGAHGISLILVEVDRPGFARGRNLDKVGLYSADTSELFFEDVRVPVANCLGQENAGFG